MGSYNYENYQQSDLRMEMSIIKPYLLLVGHKYYPEGWRDFKGLFNTLHEASESVNEVIKNDPDPPYGKHSKVEYYWYQIVDLRTCKIVLKSE